MVSRICTSRRLGHVPGLSPGQVDCRDWMAGGAWTCIHATAWPKLRRALFGGLLSETEAGRAKGATALLTALNECSGLEEASSCHEEKMLRLESLLSLSRTCQVAVMRLICGASAICLLTSGAASAQTPGRHCAKPTADSAFCPRDWDLTEKALWSCLKCSANAAVWRRPGQAQGFRVRCQAFS